MRLKVDDGIIFFNSTNDFLYKIFSIKKNFIAFIFIKKIIKAEALSKISIIIPYIKQEKMIIIAKQAIEFGCSKIYFTHMDHSINQVKEDKLYKNIIEALEQSNGNILPEIYYNQKGLKNIISKINNKIICGHLNSENYTLENLEKESEITVLIGPEGGFSQKEKTLIEEAHNIYRIRIGNRILRCETASSALLGIANLYLK